MHPFIAQRESFVRGLYKHGVWGQYESIEACLENLDPQTFAMGMTQFRVQTGLVGDAHDLADNNPKFFCGLPTIAPFRGGGVCKWPGRPVTWHSEGALGNISATDFRDSHATAMGWINEVCNAGLVYTANSKTANILCYAKRLDGPGGILAQMMLPCGANMQSQMQGQFDLERLVISENPPPGYMDIVRINCHEDIHGMGVDHGPAGNLLAPTYNERIRKPQAWDIGELVKRYGPPVSQPIPPPVPVPTPTPDPVGDEVVIRIRGDLLSASGYRIYKVQ